MVTLQPDGYTVTNATPAALEIRSDGTVYATTGLGDNSLSFQYNWLENGTASDYEVRASSVTGTYSSGTTGTWLNLGTTQAWTRVAAENALQTVSATFDIRNASTLVDLASAVISITCDRSGA